MARELGAMRCSESAGAPVVHGDRAAAERLAETSSSRRAIAGLCAAHACLDGQALLAARGHRRQLADVRVPRLAARLPTPLSCRRSAEFLGESDEKPFRPPDVAEPIRVLIPDDFAYELGSALTEPLECIVDVVHGEHDAQVAESVHRSVPVIGDDRWRDKAGEFEPAVAVRRPHHGNLDALVAQSGDTSRPFSFDGVPALEFEAEFAKEINRRCEVVDDDADVVHSLNGHAPTLQSRVRSDNANAA